MSKVNEKIDVVVKPGKAAKQPKKKSKKAKKAKKGIKKAYGGRANNFLKSINPYYEAVMRPFEISGVKIPDMDITPSVTFTTVDRFQVTVNAQGVAGAICTVGAPSNLWNTTFTTATSAALTWQGSWAATAQYTAINTNFWGLRVVGQGIAASYQGTSLNNSGRFVTSFVPRQNGLSLPQASMTVISNTALSQITPVRGGYAQCVYFPQDTVSQIYQNPGVGLVTGIGTGPQAFLTIVADGMVAGQIVQFTIVSNYEAICASSTLNWLTPLPSHADPLELASAVNRLSETIPTLQPPAGVAPADEAIQSGTLGLKQGLSTDSHPIADLQKSGNSFMDRVMGLIDSPAAKGAMSIASKVAPALLSVL